MYRQINFFRVSAGGAVVRVPECRVGCQDGHQRLLGPPGTGSSQPVANRAPLPPKWPPLPWNVADSCELTAPTKPTQPSICRDRVGHGEGCNSRDAGRSGVRTPGGGASFFLTSSSSLTSAYWVHTEQVPHSPGCHSSDTSKFASLAPASKPLSRSPRPYALYHKKKELSPEKRSPESRRESVTPPGVGVRKRAECIRVECIRHPGCLIHFIIIPQCLHANSAPPVP